MFNKKTTPWWIGAGALVVLVAVVLGIGSWQAAENGKSGKKSGKSKKKDKK